MHSQDITQELLPLQATHIKNSCGTFAQPGKTVALSTPGTHGAEVEEMGMHKENAGPCQAERLIRGIAGRFSPPSFKTGALNLPEVDGHLALCANYSTQKWQVYREGAREARRDCSKKKMIKHLPEHSAGSTAGSRAPPTCQPLC